MASKNHIYKYYLPAIRYNYTYLNLNADVMFVLKREIEDEFHYVLICPVLCNDHHHGPMGVLKSYTENSHLCTNY